MDITDNSGWANNTEKKQAIWEVGISGKTEKTF